jgi:DNA repair exonuclease SbcCD ATPase subunit
MTDNNLTLRNTTISLDEYNKLVNEATTLRETKGALQTTIDNLNKQIVTLNEKQPLVKVIHYTSEVDTHYDDWRDDMVDEPWKKMSKVEYTNLSDVTTVATEQAKAKVEKEITDLKEEIKRLKEQIEYLNDARSQSDREVAKTLTKKDNELDDKKEEYSKNILKLKKAFDEDAKNYKETIKELKEEIQKVKDSKTDVEIEEKRNKEIKDLKGRIKDLEKMIEELGKLNIFSRLFKLRTISTERLIAQKELLEKEYAANRVGTTWVKEGGKYRKYNAFEEVYNTITVKAQDLYHRITCTGSSKW